MNSMHAVNVFDTFGQEENNFTNGLFALLRILAYETPDFVKSFLKALLDINSEVEWQVARIKDTPVSPVEDSGEESGQI